jgi:hypothetical protein
LSAVITCYQLYPDQKKWRIRVNCS